MIKIFTTGGSLDKGSSTAESAFVVQAPRVQEILRESNVTFEYEIEPLFRKDSLEITEADRERILAAVREDPCERILITHGTDTMVETGLRLGSVSGKSSPISFSPAAPSRESIRACSNRSPSEWATN